MATKWTPELNALVKQRGGLEKGSDEYNIVQNKINAALGSSTRHDLAKAPTKPLADLSTGGDASLQEPSKVELTRKDMPKGYKSKAARRDLDANAVAVASAFGGAMKKSGTGNAYATLTSDGSSYTPVNESDREALKNRDTAPTFVSAEIADQMRNKPDYDAQALDAGIENRYTSKGDLNKAWRQGEVSDDDYRTAKADLKSTRKADKAQAKRVKDRDKIAAKSAKKKAKDELAEDWKAKKTTGAYRSKGEYKRFMKKNPDLFA